MIGLRVYPPVEFVNHAHISSFEDYKRMWERSIKEPDAFWAEIAEREITWFKKWDKVFTWEAKEPAWEFKWFEGGKLNAAFNCLDRHITTWRKNKVAIIWEPDDPSEPCRIFTYNQLYREVCKFANVLKSLGVGEGDRVCIYLPMIPELVVAMLACARIGAVHSVVFGGFSQEALRERLVDSEARVLVTANYGCRGGRRIPLKANADKAVQGLDFLKKVVVVKRTPDEVEMSEGRDFWWHQLMQDADENCPCVERDAEDPLFILYTSGSTGKPKGVVHTTGGYMVYVALTTRFVFDLKDEDIFWCTADIGWVTGHSYIVYGPLAIGATEVMFEGVPTYPEPDRFWQVCEKHGVTVFYTAPTAIRALMRQGDEWVDKHPLKTLRLLGTVGEPINPEAWLWYYQHVGKSRCPVVDTWWQTETGGILITTLPGAMGMKPGAAGFPLFGVETKVLRQDGTQADIGEDGSLVLCRPWPAMLRTVYRDPERFRKQYFEMFPGYYFTGDGCRIDEDGFHWLLGRIDDVINVSGHRLGTAEIESALVEHPAVAEAAVVGFPHDVKGQGIYCYVTLKSGVEPTEDLRKELRRHVRQVIGPIATPDHIQFADALPKTRSGKIMRRILRKIAAGIYSGFGDTSTLADPGVIDDLIAGNKELMAGEK